MKLNTGISTWLAGRLLTALRAQTRPCAQTSEIFSNKQAGNSWLLQEPALFPADRGLDSHPALGIPVFPLLATARFCLLFLDRDAEQDPGASGRRCLTVQEEIPV